MAAHRIFVAKDTFKFSCAHMTVFPDGTKERLHGHNYTLAVALDLAAIGLADLIDFGPLKAALRELCAEWRERTLLAAKNPHFRVVADDGQEIEFLLCGQRYVLPRGDVLLLPITNVVVEELAALVADMLSARPAGSWRPGVVSAIEVTVCESPGQGAVHRRERAPA
jgi:6-pyruvoyltetrahydropterin/6-carboxytetrahydropterin synthase